MNIREPSKESSSLLYVSFQALHEYFLSNSGFDFKSSANQSITDKLRLCTAQIRKMRVRHACLHCLDETGPWFAATAVNGKAYSYFQPLHLDSHSSQLWGFKRHQDPCMPPPVLADHDLQTDFNLRLGMSLQVLGESSKIFGNVMTVFFKHTCGMSCKRL